MTATSVARAEDAPAQASGQASTGSAASPFTSGVGQDDGFAAPNGQLGAGLSISKVQAMRAYAELGFSTTGFEIGDAEIQYTSLSLVVGGGYKIKPELELEAMLPFAMAAASVDAPGNDDSETGWAVGNLHLGVNYVRAMEPALRFKVGGAVEWGPWTIDPDDNFGGALILAPPKYAAQDAGLWAYETVVLATPARIEYGRQVVFGADGGFVLTIPTDGRDTNFSVQIDPGIGVYATPTVLVGARLPFVWTLTESGDGATQFAFEPYGRFDVSETAFLNARLTLNIDDPYGFAFDEGKVWGLHVGGGGTF